MSTANEIRAKVSLARTQAPHIAVDTAERWIAEGITPDEASMRLYDLISEPVEAAKVVAQYRASKGKV